MNSQHTVGFGNSGRSSSRVLKPPVSLFILKNAIFIRVKKRKFRFAKKIDKKREKKENRAT